MRQIVAVGAVLLLAVSARATDPVTLRSLFPKEADVFTDGPGLVRLDLPPELVSGCLSNLADLRLFDLEGNEVPFLLDAPRVESVFEAERLDVRPLEARREETPRDKGPTLRRETFELAGPASAARAGEWRLELEIAQPQFVAQVRVTVKGRAPGAAGDVTGSVFRMSSPRPVEKLSLPLGAAAVGAVVVVIEHEQPFWLAPSFRFESSRTIERSGSSAVPLTVVSTRSVGGSTVVELARPRGVVPSKLRMVSSTAVFDRRVTVNDEGPNRGAAALGDAHLFRLFPESGVEDLELAVRPARGDLLSIVIEDGDSPPLAGLAFTAVFAQPSLVASLTGTNASEPAAVLRFGGGRASVPHYDLAGFVPAAGREVYGKRAEALVRLYDPAVIRAARLGAIRPNPAFDSTPALSFAMRAGASIDPRAFAWRRLLQIQPSPEGLSRLRLAPDDLAVLRPDLADLRIVDAARHQWPYLVERADAAIDVPLAVAAASKDRATIYKLSSGTSPLSLDRLDVDTDVPFFDRAYQLVGEGEDGKTTALARGRLARARGDAAPVTIGCGAARVTRMELRIEDGDDAPLALKSVRARIPVPDVFLAAPAGAYTLLLGADGSAAPLYELARVRDVVLSVGSGEVRPGPIEANPEYSRSSGWMRGSGREQTLLWVALIGAIVVLGGLTLRLTRQNLG